MRVFLLVLCIMFAGSVDSYAFKFGWPGQGKAAAKKAEDLYRKARNAYGTADYSKVIALTTQAIKEDPKHAKSYALRGKGKKDMGDVDGAFKDLDKAISMDPDLGEAYYVRGQANEIMGEMKKAQSDYDKGCKHGFKTACP